MIVYFKEVHSLKAGSNFKATSKGFIYSLSPVVMQKYYLMWTSVSLTLVYVWFCFSSLRVPRASGSRNWLPGFAVTSHGLWIRSRVVRRKTPASTPSYRFSRHWVNPIKINFMAMVCRCWYKCVCKFQEAESKPQCRRLQLKDIIPIEMQRLTKYPLLLENIAKNTGTFLQHVKTS